MITLNEIEKDNLLSLNISVKDNIKTISIETFYKKLFETNDEKGFIKKINFDYFFGKTMLTIEIKTKTYVFFSEKIDTSVAYSDDNTWNFFVLNLDLNIADKEDKKNIELLLELLEDLKAKKENEND